MKTSLGTILPILSVISIILRSSLSPTAAIEQNITMPLAELESVKFIAMTFSVAICALAAAYAVAKISVAAIASATEKPEILGRTIIFVGLAEGIAIYGLLVAFLIWIS